MPYITDFLKPRPEQITSRENLLLWVLRDLVAQHCSEEDDVYDSGFLSADASAIRTLIHYGYMEVVSESDIMPSTGEKGRWVSAKLVDEGKTPYVGKEYVAEAEGGWK